MPTEYPGITTLAWIHNTGLNRLQLALLRAGLKPRLNIGGGAVTAHPVTLTGAAKMTVKTETDAQTPKTTELTFRTGDIDFPRDAIWLVQTPDGTHWLLAPLPPHIGAVTTQKTTSQPGSDPVTHDVTIKIPAAPRQVTLTD